MENQQRAEIFDSNNFINVPGSGNILTQPMMIPNTSSVAPPPIPPRRQVNNSMQAMQSPYGYGGAWGMNRYYNQYSQYNQFNPMFRQNTWGPSGDVENHFVQFAEASTRPAFQSIEAMVHTFSSLTMMFESTFFAMTNSFRAILGVAENMGKLRMMLKNMFGSFAAIRFIKWLYLKVKYLIGLKNPDGTASTDVLWGQTISEVMTEEGAEKIGSSSWPVFLFFGIIFLTPYLISRVTASARDMEAKINTPKEWFRQKEKPLETIALFDFLPRSSEELPLKAGQKVWLAPSDLQLKNYPGWCRATDTVKIGLIPVSYVRPLAPGNRKPSGFQTPPMDQQPIVNEPAPVMDEVPSDLNSN
ncbi:hypothetical protein TKK_0013137 [Trichogramma kaykai]|uniref:Peroxisomal membrane protein PEX13 n=1 Tax=Trichogramma kaykai TaxID=54128 RepID=A0ABD2WKY2_9HYME